MITRAQLDELRNKWVGSHTEMPSEQFKELLDTIDALLNVAEAAQRFYKIAQSYKDYGLYDGNLEAYFAALKQSEAPAWTREPGMQAAKLDEAAGNASDDPGKETI